MSPIVECWHTFQRLVLPTFYHKFNLYEMASYNHDQKKDKCIAKYQVYLPNTGWKFGESVSALPTICQPSTAYHEKNNKLVPLKSAVLHLMKQMWSAVGKELSNLEVLTSALRFKLFSTTIKLFHIGRLLKHVKIS